MTMIISLLLTLVVLVLGAGTVPPTAYLIAWHDIDHVNIAVSFQLAEARELYDRLSGAKLLKVADTDQAVGEYGPGDDLRQCRNAINNLGSWLLDRVVQGEHRATVPLQVVNRAGNHDYVVQAPSLKECNYMVVWDHAGQVRAIGFPDRVLAQSLYRHLRDCTKCLMVKRTDEHSILGEYLPNLPGDLFKGTSDRDIIEVSGNPSVIQLYAAQVRNLFRNYGQ